MPNHVRASNEMDSRPLLAVLLRAGLACALADAFWAAVLAVSYGGSFVRTWQGVAATLFGRAMLTGGLPAALVGLTMHVGVAFTWSGVFLATYIRSASLRRVTSSRAGVLVVSAVYGPAIWMVMSLAVIPLLTHRPPSLSWRWVVQLCGHAVFVGLPIVWSVRRPGSERLG